MSQSISFEGIVNVLQDVEIFKRIPPDVLLELAKKVIISNLNTNETVISQGDKGSSMYVIISGDVKVHDREYVIANISSGSFFGEFSLLDDEPRSLSVTTLIPCVIGNIQQVDFFHVLNKYPEITRDIIKVMLKRLRTQNQQIINQLREKQKELEELVRIRTLDLKEKNEDLLNTLNELRRTQEQLVQQAKLASLGQITAGIAHEIQNPLNFINNFSSLSKELADEIISSSDKEEQLEIISDLKINLSKIEEHGKRADSIVKGMLLHSKSSKGEKQNTNLCTLAEQSLNLAVNSFSANYPGLKYEIIKNFPADVPVISVAPQDVSRVIINIINNALYAINQKQKNSDGNYIPKMKVNVEASNGVVAISVFDNGIGIPESHKDRMFQPFFTTKPTGQGTGLGLSTGFEIIKANGGEIQMESKDGEYSIFTIRLPYNRI